MALESHRWESGNTRTVMRLDHQRPRGERRPGQLLDEPNHQTPTSSSMAIVSPVGPAPTTSTGICREAITASAFRTTAACTGDDGQGQWYISHLTQAAQTG